VVTAASAEALAAIQESLTSFEKRVVFMHAVVASDFEARETQSRAFRVSVAATSGTPDPPRGRQVVVLGSP
ncbi:MAG: hypothetical protein ACREJ3_09225, partial [Polyangiaceae bacterium]